jgi:transcriptional regulator with XRE-family HTH domain
MDTRQALGAALKSARRSRGLTQEDFGEVSSRTYLSTLERGLKSPTLDKIEEIASVLAVHPLTFLCLIYMQRDSISLNALLKTVEADVEQLA